MVQQNYQSLIEMTSNMIYNVAFGGGFKCPRKIHLNTQCRGRSQTTFTRGEGQKMSIFIKVHKIENVNEGGVGGQKKPKTCQRSL